MSKNTQKRKHGFGDRIRFRVSIWRHQSRNTVWIEPALSVVVAVTLCTLIWLLDHFVRPTNMPTVAVGEIANILTILSSSMLTVATFALGTVVTALVLASVSQTPRVTELLIQDRGERAAISAFIGSFVFAVTAQTALVFNLYGPVGETALLFTTLIVLSYMVMRLVMFIRTMTRLGQMSDTIERLSAATRASLRRYRRHPFPPPKDEIDLIVGLTQDMPIEGRWLRLNFEETGYITHIDVSGLAALADQLGAILHVQARTGSFVTPGREAVVIESLRGEPPRLTKEDREAFNDSFVISINRSFDHDPRFGFIALGEIAQRALSPAVNDPGTAIAVANAVTSIILNPELDHPPTARDRSLAPTVNVFTVNNVTVLPINEGEFIHDAFGPIGRDGAGNAALVTRILKLLAAIAEQTEGHVQRAALDEAALLCERADVAVPLASERHAIDALYRQLFSEQRLSEITHESPLASFRSRS